MTRRPRTFKSFVLRVLVPRALVFGAGATMLLVGQAMAVSPSVGPSGPPLTEPAGQPSEQVLAGPPSWTAADAAAYPGCVRSAAWPTGRPAERVVVHSFREDRHRALAFDVAWRLNHNDTEADDVWVVGVCGRP